MAITVTAKMVPYHLVNHQRLIWRSNTDRFNLQILDYRRTRSDLSGMVGYRDCCTANYRQMTYRQTSNIWGTLVGNKIVDDSELHLLSRLKTWLQWIGQRQLQDETRLILEVWRCLTSSDYSARVAEDLTETEKHMKPTSRSYTMPVR